MHSCHIRTQFTVSSADFVIDVIGRKKNWRGLNQRDNSAVLEKYPHPAAIIVKQPSAGQRQIMTMDVTVNR